jgi:hypothetical protein
VPFSIIPERGQVSENSAKSPSKESCDVFHFDEFGSNFANQAGEVAPQPASCAVKTRSTACETKVLAGKSSNDCIRSNAVRSQSICGKLSNIIIDGNPRIALSKTCARFSIELAQRHGLETASSLQAQVKAADARK